MTKADFLTYIMSSLTALCGLMAQSTPKAPFRECANVLHHDITSCCQFGMGCCRLQLPLASCCIHRSWIKHLYVLHHMYVLHQTNPCSLPRPNHTEDHPGHSTTQRDFE
jgi:hypothetical protein